MSEDPTGSDLTIPSLWNGEESRPTTAVVINRDPRLYTCRDLGNQSKKYEVVAQDPESVDTIFLANTPGLLAITNKTAKAKAASRPVTVRPISAAKLRERVESQLHSQISPVKKKPLPSLADTTSKTREIQSEKERLTLEFKDDPISYFSKHKDGTGHHFIYMVYSLDRDDPNFSPYDIVKVPHTELGKGEYFTMSAGGVTRIQPDGTTDTISLDEWAFESACYRSIGKLKFFKTFRYWKRFVIWRQFVQRQRYEYITSRVFSKCMFQKDGYFDAFSSINFNMCDPIILEHLLVFTPQMKYTAEEYSNLIVQNTESLKTKFRQFLNQTIETMLTLDAEIRDPQKFIIKASDVTKHMNYFPNLGYLLEVSRKKDIEKGKRQKVMHKEVLAFGDFIRTVDYLILESLQKSCFQSWINAEANITTHMSAIFQIDIYFTHEGDIAFSPSEDELIKIVTEYLDNSIVTLNSLPRVLMSSQLRPHLRERYAPIDNLFAKGPKLTPIVNCNEEYKHIKERIIQVIKKSYADAFEHSQGFTHFFDLFQLSYTWDPEKYIGPRGGDSINFDLFKYASDFDRDQEPLSYNPAKEKVVDFPTLRKDVEHFKEEDQAISQFHACTVQGVVYINSKELRRTLMPIPVRSMQAINTALKELLNQKLDHMSAIFRFCGKRLKKEPGTLNQYVENSEFNKMTKNMVPYLLSEIEFVDELQQIIDTFEFSSSNHGQGRNPLRSMFRQFITDQSNAATIEENHNLAFVAELHQRVDDQMRELKKFRQQLDSAPTEIEDLDIGLLVQNTTSLNEKIMSVEKPVQHLNRCQQVMEVQAGDLSLYDEVRNDALFILKIYASAEEWQKIQHIIQTVPFNEINIPEFCNRITTLGQDVNDMIETQPRKLALLDNLNEALNKVYPYLDSMEILYNGNMHFHHWNKLFEECGYEKTYYAQIKIEELLSLGILAEKDKIDRITMMSTGEAQLEKEYKALFDKWVEIRLPIVESQIKTNDSLILERFDEMLQEIADAHITVQKMLAVPFVQGLKVQVLNLGAMLETFITVLEKWRIFQENWTVLSVFFAKEETKQSLPQLAGQFANVRRRWMSLIKHIMENPRLWRVCEYPSIVEIFKENNQTLQYVMKMSLKYIDNKRVLFPRLFFLSNHEVLRLYSVTDFDLFNKILSKLFMRIRKLETHSLDQSESELAKNLNSQNFNRIKIYAMQGINGDTLLFTKTISCVGQFETWCNTLIDVMKVSTQAAIGESIHKYMNNDLLEWITATPMFIIHATIEFMFNRNIEECFNNFENDIRTFLKYETYVRERLKTLREYLDEPITDIQRQRINSLIALVINMHSISKDLTLINGAERRMYWEATPKLKFNMNGSDGCLLVDSHKVPFGYEFWGDVTDFIFCKTTSSLYGILSRCYIGGINPIIYGCNGIGKKTIVATAAMSLGKFIFFAPSFNEPASVTLMRCIAGAMWTGSWVVFANIDLSSNVTQALLVDLINAVKRNMGKTKSMQVGNVKVRKTQGYHLMATAGPNCLYSEKITESLRQTMMPIALIAPDVNKIVATQLFSHGFSNEEEVAGRLVCMMKRIPSILDYFPSKDILWHSFKLIKIADDIKRGCECNEEDAIARAAFHHYLPFVHEADTDIFIELIHKAFGHTELHEFQKMIKETGVFGISQRVLKMSEFLDNTGNTVSMYVREKAQTLFGLMLKYRAVIIYGPPYSGKSSALDMLINAIGKTKGEKPIKVFEIFHGCKKRKTIFGSVTYYDDGPVFDDGVLTNTLKEIEMVKGYKKIMRFNGPMSIQFFDQLANMLGATPVNDVYLNSLDILNKEDTHIIIETDSIDGLNPSILPYVGFLPMENLQKSSINTRIIFQRVDQFQLCRPETKQRCATIFTQIFPLIRSEVEKLPSVISDKATRDIMINDILPAWVFKYAFSYIIRSSATEENKEHVRLIIIHSMYIVYQAILHPDSIIEFDAWIRRTFLVMLPIDWVQFNLPKCYCQEFPLPSLQSVIFDIDDFKPLDCLHLNDETMVETLTIDSVPSPDQVRVMTPSFIPLINIIETLLISQQHMIISGPPMCGKTSLLKFVFARHPEIVVHTIPASTYSTSESLKASLDLATHLYQKDVEGEGQGFNIAIVFDNVPSTNIRAAEFIRKMFRIGPKSKKINMFVIVTTQTLEGFDGRFLSNFFPVSMREPSIYSKTWIFENVAKHFMIDQSIVNDALMYINDFSNGPNGFHYMHLLDTLIMSINKRDKISASNIVPVQILLSEINFLYAHKLEVDKMHAFSSKFNAHYMDPAIQQAYYPVIYGSSIYMTDLKRDGGGNYVTEFQAHRISLIREELEFMMKMPTVRADIRETIRLFRPALDDWALLTRALLLPGRNIILRGDNGNGRETVACFISGTKDFLYQVISSDMNQHEAIEKIKDIAVRAVIQPVTAVIFARIEGLHKNVRRLIEHISIQHDIFPLFSREEYGELLKKFQTQCSQKSSLRQIQRDLAYAVGSRVRFVLAVSNNYPTPSNFINIVFATYDENRSHAAAEDALVSNEASLGSVYPLDTTASLLTDCYTVVKKKAAFVNFIDFVDTFMKIYIQLREKHEENKKRASDSVDFINEIESQYQHIEDEIKRLEPMSGEKNENDIKRQNEIDRKRQNLDIRMKKIEDGENSRQSAINSKEAEIKESQKKVDEAERNIDFALNNISKNPQKLEQYSESKPFINIIELICIFTGLSTKMDVNKEKLIKEGDLYSHITRSTNNRDLKMKISQLEQTTKKIGQMNKDKDEIKTMLPYIESLFNWNNDAYALAVAKSKVEMKTEELTQLQREFKMYQQTISIEKDSMETIYENLDEEEKMLQKELTARGEAREEYQENIKKKKNMERLINRLGDLENRWTEFLATYPVRTQAVLGDSVLLAFFITFGGIAPNELYTIERIIKAADVEITKIDPYINVCSLLIQMEDISDTIQSQPIIDFHAKMLTLAMYHMLRPPLIYDPDNIIYNYILGSAPSFKINIVSAASDNLEECIIDAMTNGKILVINDVHESIPLIEHILLVERFADGSTKINVGSKEVIPKPTFRLLMFSDEPVSNIPKLLTSRTTLIDIEGEFKEVPKEYIERMFVMKNKPRNVVDLVDKRIIMSEERATLMNVDQEILETISEIYHITKEDEEYSFIDDTESFDSLLAAKEKMLEVLDKKIDYEQMDKAKQEVLSNYTSAVNLTLSIWLAISRYLPKISRFYNMSFERFASIIDDALNGSKIEAGSEFDTMDVENSIMRFVMREALPMLTTRDGLIFMFVSAFLNQCSNGNAEEEDLVEIIDHLRHELDSHCGVKISETSTADAVGQMKYVNIQSVFSLVIKLVQETFGDRFESDFPPCVIPDTTKPCFVLARHDDTTTQIGRNAKTVTMAANERVITTARKRCEEAFKVGSCVVLMYEYPDAEVAAVINGLAELYMDNSQAKKGFRMIIILRTTEFISRKLLAELPKVAWSEFPAPRITMTEIDPLRNVTSDEQLRYCYALGMVYSLTRYRAVIQPTGITDLRGPTINGAQFIIQRIIRSCLPEGTPVNGIRRLVTPAVLSSFTNSEDYERVSAQIAEVFSDQLMSERFNFAGQRSYDRTWSIPASVEQATFENLPIFPSTDPLLMDPTAGRVLRNWSMSRWIIGGFSCLSGIDMIGAEAKTSSISVMLPEPIQINVKGSTPIEFFVLSESRKYNECIKLIKEDVMHNNPSILEDIANDTTPMRWCNAVGFGQTKIFKFFSMLDMKHRLFSQWNSNSLIEINVNYISDVRMLLEVLREKGSHGALPVLEVASGKASVTLTGAVLVGWGYQMGEFKQPSQSIPPFCNLPPLMLIPEEIDDHTPTIPVYSVLPTVAPRLFVDGRPDNLIARLVIRDKISQRTLLTNGVSVILHPPEAFNL